MDKRPPAKPIPTAAWAAAIKLALRAGSARRAFEQFSEQGDRDVRAALAELASRTQKRQAPTP